MTTPQLRYDLISPKGGTIASLANIDEIRQTPGMGHINNHDALLAWAIVNNIRVEASCAPGVNLCVAPQGLELDPEFKKDLERKFNTYQHPMADEIYDIAKKIGSGKYMGVMEGYEKLVSTLCHQPVRMTRRCY